MADTLFDDILHEIYFNTKDGTFLQLGELEVLFGRSGAALRAYLEDLKEAGYVIETSSGFQASRSGIYYAQVRWV